MRYKISSKEEDIYDFIESAAIDDIFPSKIETLTLKCPVPMGTKELIAQDVKKELAKELRLRYQKEFFVALYEIADEIQSNHARTLLWNETEELTGLFDEERLKRFEELVEYSYSCRKLEKNEYRLLMQWLQEEKANMNENISGKDVFEKTIYGIAYEKDGKMHYIHNAQRGSIYREMYEAEMNGQFVTPLYGRTYWYNYKYRLSDAINDYKIALRQARDETFRNIVRFLKSDPSLVEKNYDEKLLIVENLYGINATETMRRYLFRWGAM